MLIPKCCKNCANKEQLKFGCMCDEPIRCVELVEDDEDIKRYEAMAKSAPQLGNWVKRPDCKDKDHRIAVLERAIYLLAYYTPCDRCPIGKYKCKGGQDCENQLKQYFIKQAEKELEDEAK